MHFPSFHSFSWSSRISVDSASFLRVASSMFASRAMDLRDEAAGEFQHPACPEGGGGVTPDLMRVKA